MAQEMCSIHTDREIVERCAHCGRGVCAECAATLADKVYCLECIKHIDASASGQIKEIAWEKRRELGFFSAFLGTWKEVVLHPKNFFSGMPMKAGIGQPFLFALLSGSLAIIITAIVNIIVVLSGAAGPTLASGSGQPSNTVLIISNAALMALSPIIVCLGIFIASAVYHLFVLLFAGKEGFGATFRVLSYANALALLNPVPIVGPLFVAVYSAVLFTIGFKHVQKMSTAKAVMAAILPMLILFILGFALAFYIVSHGALIAPGSPAGPIIAPVAPPAP